MFWESSASMAIRLNWAVVSGRVLDADGRGAVVVGAAVAKLGEAVGVALEGLAGCGLRVGAGGWAVFSGADLNNHGMMMLANTAAASTRMSANCCAETRDAFAWLAAPVISDVAP
jgi:hypothetical protein